MSTASPPTGGAEHALRAIRIASDYRKRILDPVHRFSEVIFGLIMVLTFTGAFSVAQGGREDVRQMLVAALGCNFAWGLVDGVMYVLTSVAERARLALIFRGVRRADPEAARAIVLASLPDGFVPITDRAEADRIVARIRGLTETPFRGWVSLEDVRGAIGSAILVVVATFPPTLPFLFVADATRALRISNAVAVASLFLAGYWLGKATGLRAWLLGLSMVVLGVALVGLTVALGG